MTTGSLTIHKAPRFVSPSVVGSVAAPNVSVTTTASRTIHIQGYLETGSGKTITACWHQQLNVIPHSDYLTFHADILCSHSLSIRRSILLLHRTTLADR